MGTVPLFLPRRGTDCSSPHHFRHGLLVTRLGCHRALELRDGTLKGVSTEGWMVFGGSVFQRQQGAGNPDSVGIKHSGPGRIQNLISRARRANRGLLVGALALSVCTVLYSQQPPPPTNLRIITAPPPSRRIPPPPPPPPTGPAYAYFNTLVARADHWRSYSLRDQAHLTYYSAPNQDINYVWPNDPDPRKQDAAKLVIPSNGSGGAFPTETNRNSIHQVRLPMDGMELGHSYLVTWDAWYGDEWRYAISGIPAHKAFQFDGPTASVGMRKSGGKLPQLRSSSAYTVARMKSRVSRCGTSLTDTQKADGTFDRGSSRAERHQWIHGNTHHTLWQWNIRPEKWVRHWQLIEYGMDPNPWRTNPPGTLMSLWVADEDRPPMQVYDRLQVTLWPPGIQESGLR